MKLYRLLPWIVGLVLFMENLDVSIINTALPKMAFDFYTTPIHLKLAITSYVVTLGIFIPLSSWLVEHFGSQKVFISAIILFTLSSIGCGQSKQLYELVIMRVLQGIGGAVIIPVARFILLSSVEKSKQLTTISNVFMIAITGALLGPSLGGMITQYLSWRWNFYINIVPGLVTVILLHQIFKRTKIKINKSVKKADWLGFILFGIGLSLLLYLGETVYEPTTSIFSKLFLGVLGFILLSTYIFYARNKKNPLLDLELFKIRTFRLTAIGTFSTRITTGSIPFLLPLFYQISLGFSPSQAGLLILPNALGAITAKPFVQRVLKKFNFKNGLLASNFLIFALIATLSSINRPQSVWMVVIFMFLYGIVASFQFSCVNTLIFADVPQEKLSQGTALNATLQQLSYSVGVTLSGLILELLVDSKTLDRFIPTRDFHYTFLIMGAITLLSNLTFMRLTKSDGKVLSGYNEK